ncbi:hypothetical protein CC2G_006921 [Coprinopsis cinerea AmutBmut pab1-1]|nr:hypothetical protein CC2G_006921 [Coprinopsis cinerea AmutBmut pab1-1]
MSLFLVPGLTSADFISPRSTYTLDNSPSHAAKAALSDVKPPVPLGWKRSSASRRAPGAPVDPGYDHPGSSSFWITMAEVLAATYDNVRVVSDFG